MEEGGQSGGGGGGEGGGGGGGEGSGGSGGGRGKDGVKLFVGQVPKHMTEAQLLAMFREVALVDEVSTIKDKATKASRGCCFLICPSRQEADKAVNACHNKRTLPGASSPLQVKYADGELERLEHKLFIGMLPKNVSDAEVSTLFSKYGNIKDLQILRGSQQTSKGCAFLKYETKEQALTALECVNGKYRMEALDTLFGITPAPIVLTIRCKQSSKLDLLLKGWSSNGMGSSAPLVVKWADTEKERQARRVQKAQSQAYVPNIYSIQQPSLFGALPMGYIPPYSGFGYQSPGNYGLMQHPAQNSAAFHTMMPHVNQGNVLRGTMNRSFSVPGLQYPLAYPGGMMMGQRPLGNSHGPLGPAQQHVKGNSSPATSPSISTSSGGQIEGPPGANLFIYHLPQQYGDVELSNAFQGFGRVLSAKVFVDKATGVSKCFGFVSYDSPEVAQAAIDLMDGFQLDGKKLKVQLKRVNNQTKPIDIKM